MRNIILKKLNSWIVGYTYFWHRLSVTFDLNQKAEKSKTTRRSKLKVPTGEGGWLNRRVRAALKWGLRRHSGNLLVIENSHPPTNIFTPFTWLKEWEVAPPFCENSLQGDNKNINLPPLLKAVTLCEVVPHLWLVVWSLVSRLRWRTPDSEGDGFSRDSKQSLKMCIL